MSNRWAAPVKAAQDEKKPGFRSSTKAEKLYPKEREIQSKPTSIHEIKTVEVRDQDALQSGTRDALPIDRR